ncbi:peptide ABC transporter substrate-binding protein [Microbacterium koreense]|uniref:Peptide ABC transporter substrate-binding protein n=1 Tax=Microbacterium koreense TaxID=323761 RepID=A0ABW2ZQW1_9MICO
MAGGVAAVSLVLTGCGASSSGEEASSGGIAVVGLVGEPGVLNPMFISEDSALVSESFVMEPLFTLMADGTFAPTLAAEVPTVGNGGVSEDGLEITYTLREGITWSDGEDFTTEDLAFTVEVAQDAEGAALPIPEYSSIVDVEVVDDLTLTLTLSQPELGYLQLFAQTLPAHRFDTTAIQLDDPLVRMPLGTGPFVFEEWRSGDEIILTANEDYWRDPELPHLDGVTVKITPDQQTATAGFIAGDYDTLFFISSGDFPVIESAVDDGAPIEFQLDTHFPGYVEYLWLNHSDQGSADQGHPVLSDPAVREAIDRGIDREAIVDDLLGGYGVLTGAFLSSGFGSVQRDATAYDPEGAAAVLDEAGWAVGADGIREKDGVRASLRFQTISGDQDRVLYQQLIQQNMADIGIELIIENVEAGRLFDSFAGGGLLATGDYDIAMSRDGRYADPGLWVYTFTSLSIPTEENGGDGFTYSHWRNAEYDELGYVASTTLDPDARAEVLAEIDELFVTERVAIPIYATVLGLAWNESLQGVESDFWTGIWATDGTAEWSLQN